LDAGLLFAVVAIAVLVGILIGTIGIGGVLLVPVLTQVLAFPLVAAISATMLAYLFSGAVGTALHARHRHVDWRSAGALAVTAAPTAFAGAVLVATAGGPWLLLFISLALLLSGSLRLFSRAAPHRCSPLAAYALATIGIPTGIGSALTGTSGPVVLLPMLLTLRLPALSAIGLSQAVQLPVAGAATAANVLTGVVEVPLGLTLGAGLAAGAAIGTSLVRFLPVAGLERVVSISLLIAGALLLVRSAPLIP